MRRRKLAGQSGSTIVEFAIMAPCLVLMFFGSVGMGLMLGRYVQAVQVCRDVAHMYSDGVDFSQANNQNIIIQQLAQGVGMTATGGNGVIYLSKVSTVYQVDCDAAGFSASCNNKGLPVFTQRIAIGQQSLRSGDFGTPNSAILDAQGNISPSVYMKNTDSSVRTSGFEAVLDDAVQRATGSAATPPAQAQGDVAYVAELFFTYPDIGFLGWSTAGGAYARFIFR
ncbi:MAG: pilus assembly protein [Acidobacteriota bacterium]|nr:pilus assembly protein [Acidobacteriota bacterium]